MPAIDALPTTPVELRSGGQTPAASDNSATTDTAASDAFIAALLAQSTLLPANPEPPIATAALAVASTGGQELPALRPTIAAQLGSRRAVGSAVADNAMALQAPAAGAVEEDFAAAFATLQDTMMGAGGGEHSVSSDADGVMVLFSDLTSSAGNAVRAEQTLAAMAGVHGAHNQEAAVSSQAYATKPGALPIDQPALFGERLNQHINIMLGEQVHSAQIAVTPPDLGPVEVRVTLVGDEAKIELVASHATTREALADALPRLRASFADAGLSLAQAGVFAQMPERQHAKPAFDAHAGHGESDFEHPPLAALTPARALRIGLIDAFV